MPRQIDGKNTEEQQAGWTPPRGLPLLARISDYLPWYAQRTPDNEALVLENRRITYAQLQQQVDACAKALLALGVKKGNRVAVLSTPHPDFFISYLAATSIGAVWMGLNPRYQLDEYRYVVADAEPVLIMARTQIDKRDYRQNLQTLKQENPCITAIVVLNGDPALDLNKESHSKPDAVSSLPYSAFIEAGKTVTASQLQTARDQVRTSDPALLVYTSGTTGKPKGALLPHRGLIKCALVQLGYLDIEPIRILNFFPINHVACVCDTSNYCFVGGGAMVLMEQFDVERSLALVERERLTLWGGIPTTLQMSLAHENFSSYNFSSVRMIIWGGAAAPISLIEKLQSISPRLCNVYGLTETVGNVTFSRQGDSIEALTTTIGKPADCYDIRIVNNAGETAAVGEQGEILVAGDFIMLGYLNKPEATAEAIDQDGWLHTGDLGVWREDGNIQLVGRCKEMFKSGGYNVYPLEIEQVLETHPAIDCAVVVPVPDELYSEVGYAFLQLAPQPEGSIDAIKQYCKQKLANYKIPKYFQIEGTLPLLPVGKVDRGKLIKLAKQSLKSVVIEA